jgi:anti-anti-sigma factor
VDAGGQDALEVGVTLALHGDLTFESADRWHEAAMKALDLRPSTLVVDLGQVHFLDSSGMYVLVRLRRRAEEVRVRLEIVNVHDAVMLALRTADLTSYLGIADPALA